MIYQSAQAWRDAAEKHVLLFGMSGLGKTHLSNLLRSQGDWYHYSIDYRIGTRYMGEHIVDNFKRAAMQVPLLRELLMSDSIYIGSNITFDNLAPLSTYLGKPGDPALGGLPIEEYKRRQAQHARAETAALLDTAHFIDRAQSIYTYPHFVCDSGGSICEVVDPDDRNDKVLTALASSVLLVWIEGNDAHTDALIRRFDSAPKPMCYQPAFLTAAWTAYLQKSGTAEQNVDPDAFLRFIYARALAHRQPRYSAMAANWGIKINADKIADIRDAADFTALIAASMPG